MSTCIGITKSTGAQCTHKRKFGEFCGVHKQKTMNKSHNCNADHCCICSDKRPSCSTNIHMCYIQVYVDGVGTVQKLVDKNLHYCDLCKYK